MLGGMSWESMAEYHRLANELVRQRLGGLHSARIVVTSLDFADVERLQVEGRWDEAGDLLARAAVGVEAAGAQLLILCTNTMHKVADQVQSARGYPVAAPRRRHCHRRTRGWLDDGRTARNGLHDGAGLYRDRLAAHGLTVLVPPADDRAVVHRVIYDELCLVRVESRQTYRDVITRLVDAGAEGIVLGCTEIELLIGGDDSAVPVFPTTRIHVEAAVAASLA